MATQTILQINFKFDMLPEEYTEMAQPAAKSIAQLDGLLWKVWLMNAEEQEAGGLYLFESAEAAQAYRDGPIVSQLTANPRLSETSIKTFTSIEELTGITHGPVVQSFTL